jgi:hypothetical protein
MEDADQFDAIFSSNSIDDSIVPVEQFSNFLGGACFDELAKSSLLF